MIASLIAAAAAIISARSVRRNGREANDIAKDVSDTERFETLYKAQDERINGLVKTVNELKAKVETLETEGVEYVKRLDKAQTELRQVKKVVSDWFHEIQAAWTKFDIAEPMPLPSEADLTLLEIAVKVKTRKTT